MKKWLAYLKDQRGTAFPLVIAVTLSCLLILCGYGTVLFFEDQKVVKGLQEAFPAYQENFPGWSLQTSAMHQLAIWVMLEDVGFGASLQHYNPLIDEEVRRAWDLPEHWHLIAEMPFGLPLGKPGEKEFQPLEERVRIFK